MEGLKKELEEIDILRKAKGKKRFKFDKAHKEFWLFNPDTLKEGIEFMEEKKKEGCNCRIDRFENEELVVCGCSCYEEKR